MSTEVAKAAFWAERQVYLDAEIKFYESASKTCNGPVKKCPQSALAFEIQKTREFIRSSLENVGQGEVPARSVSRQDSKTHLTELIEKLQKSVSLLEQRVSQLEIKCGNVGCQKSVEAQQPVKKPVESKKGDDDDDDVDLFGSDSEDESAEAKQLKEKVLAEYAAKKSKKPALIAKSSIVLDVKPWDDETDMKEMEKSVRSIEMDGLVWGASKIVPIAFGIQKLQITCVVEDEKVSVDELSEKIEGFEDYVQSVDIAAFNKI